MKMGAFFSYEFDETNLASGMYFYRIIAEGKNPNGSSEKFTNTLKMVLVK